MTLTGRWIMVMLVLITIAQKTPACKLAGEDFQMMSRSKRLLGADFVIKGEDLEHFSIIEDGVNVTKVRFDVHCIFKPLATVRNVSSEILIKYVENRPCSQTHIRPGDVVVIGLKESQCAAPPDSDCDFEFHEVNAPQSCAFLATDNVLVDISRTCGLHEYHPPIFCDSGAFQNRCPVKYDGECHVSGANSIRQWPFGLFFALLYRLM